MQLKRKDKPKRGEWEKKENRERKGGGEGIRRERKREREREREGARARERESAQPFEQPGRDTGFFLQLDDGAELRPNAQHVSSLVGSCRVSRVLTSAHTSVPRTSPSERGCFSSPHQDLVAVEAAVDAQVLSERFIVQREQVIPVDFLVAELVDEIWHRTIKAVAVSSVYRVAAGPRDHHNVRPVPGLRARMNFRHFSEA